MSSVEPKRSGPYMLTYTGRRFWPTDPHPDDICLVDIAHSLAVQNRFCGHTREPYSVAQHCVLASDLVTIDMALEALFHDASEAYIVDIPRPLKYSPGMEGYKPIEAKVQRVICDKYGLPFPLHEEIKMVDNLLGHAEMRDLMPTHHIKERQWFAGTPAAGLLDTVPTVVPWPWRYAKDAWIGRYRELTRGT